MTKYGAKKVTLDDIRFDSKMEGEFYLYLKQQKSNGLIKDFELQPTFELQPKFEKDGKKYRPINYIADFKIIHNDDKIEIVDIKGFSTPVFDIKEKIYHYKFEYPLSVITYSKIDGGWIDVISLKKARAERKKIKLRNNKINT